MEYIYNKYYNNIGGNTEDLECKEKLRKLRQKNELKLEEFEKEQSRIFIDYKSILHYILSKFQLSTTQNYVILDKVLTDNEQEVFIKLIDGTYEVRIDMLKLKSQQIVKMSREDYENYQFLKKFCKKLTNTDKITLENIQDNQDITFLEEMKVKLTSLVLSNEKDYEKPFIDVEKLVPLTNLKLLKLNNISFSKEKLKELSSSIELHLLKCKLTDEDRKELTEHFTNEQNVIGCESLGSFKKAEEIISTADKRGALLRRIKELIPLHDEQVKSRAAILRRSWENHIQN